MSRKRYLLVGLMLLGFGAGLFSGVFIWGTEKKEEKKSEIYKISDDMFYRQTRFIMTKEEEEIYKHLTDNASRIEFIDSFWKKRDPDPSTDENENRIEYESRIAYANKWFNEVGRGHGWDTERGRILLILGFPDRREWGDAAQTSLGFLTTSKRVPMEVWYYQQYGLTLVFQDADDTGRFRLREIPSNLQTAMDLTKFTLDLRDKAKIKNAFKFNVSYNEGKFDIKVPTKKVNFEEKDGKMHANFEIIVYVYLESKKIDELKSISTLNFEKEELLNMKNLEFSFPYVMKEKGKYYFDIVVEDKYAFAKYRNFMTIKNK